MTNERNLEESSDGQQSLAPERSTRTRLKQLTIIFVSALILSVSSCAGMVATFFNHPKLFAVAAVIFIVGLATIPITMAWSTVILAKRSIKKRGTGR
jgi:hypothetical protein